MKKNKEKIIGVVGFILLWQIISWIEIFNPIYFSSPIETAKEAINMFYQSSIYLDIWNTFYRILITIIISMIIGAPLGIIFGYYAKFYKYVSGIIDFLRSIPPIVLYPLLLIMLGSGDVSRIGVAVFGSVIVVILIIAKGLSSEPVLKRKFFKSMGANKIQIFRQILWYEALPHIMLALRTMISLSIIIIIVTEMLVGSKYGLGVRVQNVQITSNIPDLFTTIIVIGLLGVILNKIAEWLDKKYIFWKN